MKTEQIYEIMNDVTQEVLDGVSIKEDLENIVEVGDAVFNANAYETYVKALVNRIGKTIFVNRAYRGGAPSVLMDAWEYGSVLQKIDCDIPEAQENESWNLENGVSYDPNIFKSPKVNVKFYNNQVTFEIQMSFVEKQIKQSFLNVNELNAFISMIYNAIDKSLTIKVDKLIMMTIANAIGEVLYEEYNNTDYDQKSGVRAVNLLYLYNQLVATPITKTDALQDTEFLKFASKTIALYSDYMEKISTQFNLGGRPRFTPKDMQHIVLLSEFAKASEVYLQSDTFHNELVKMPNFESVGYWQSAGDYVLDDVSKINITTSQGHECQIDGVLGVIFDRDALGVCNYERRTTSDYNARAEFINMWFKNEARYFNSFDENIVVFFIQ